MCCGSLTKRATWTNTHTHQNKKWQHRSRNGPKPAASECAPKVKSHQHESFFLLLFFFSQCELTEFLLSESPSTLLPLRSLIMLANEVSSTESRQQRWYFWPTGAKRGKKKGSQQNRASCFVSSYSLVSKKCWPQCCNVCWSPCVCVCVCLQTKIVTN